jgi:multiple sugar transport system substrate-binding protein
MQAFGGTWWDDEGNWSFNQGGAVKALEYMIDNLKAGVFDPASPTLNDRTTIDPFANGDSAFMTNWGFAWGLVNDPEFSKVVDQVAITLNPGGEAAGVVSTSCGGGAGIGITANSKNKEYAWEFVQLMTGINNPENDVAKLQLIGSPPVLQSSWEDPQVLEEHPHFAEIIKQAPYMRHRPVLPWYLEFSQTVQTELTRALGGQKDAQEALDDAVEALESRGKPPTD